ncbi:helix-turn-helix transcriptional regulator [Candidatus Pacearchaeota archaeon]|nr:helix-turn-helix transcriptional regulator [Candidatus Pacearchaeota archaeon]
MTEKVLNIDLNDSNSAIIAEIIGNKTCKRILGLIAEQDNNLSETDIARKLVIPANTVNYNIKKLIKAGLIEETKNWFWSVKGKKIKTYKLANKKIVISTKKSFKTLLLTSIFTGLIGMAVKLYSNFKELASVEVDNMVLQKGQELAYNSAPAIAESSSRLLQTTSIFQNVGLWFIFGLLAGLVLYLSYKKLKGGNN